MGEAQCYQQVRENKRYQEFVQNDVIQVSGDVARPDAITCKGWRFAAKPSNLVLLIPPGVGIIGAVLLLLWVKEPTPIRGFLVFVLFVGTCWIVTSIDGVMRELGSLPSLLVLLSSLLYGALLWFLDIFLNWVRSDQMLEAASRSNAQHEAAYDYAKFGLKAIVGVFLAVCITLVWNISTFFQTEYREVGIGGTLTLIVVGLTAWGCLGFLGWAGVVAGERLWNVVRTTPLEVISHRKQG